MKGGEGYDAEGVRGLKALGVRDLTYRMAFLACSVVPTNPRFGGRDLSGEDITAEMVKKQMTDAEWQKIYEMSQDRNLYQNIINSLFPTIHGQWLVCSVSMLYMASILWYTWSVYCVYLASILFYER